MNDNRDMVVLIDEYATLKSCEVKLEIITSVIKANCSGYGLSEETAKMIRIILDIDKESDKNDAV